MYDQAASNVEKQRKDTILKAKAKPMELLTNKILSLYGKDFDEREERIVNIPSVTSLLEHKGIDRLTQLKDPNAQRGLTDFLKEHSAAIKQFREEVAGMDHIPDDVQETIDKLNKIESITSDKKSKDEYLQKLFMTDKEFSEAAKWFAEKRHYTLKSELSKPVPISTNIQLQSGSMSGLDGILASVRNFLSGRNVQVNMPVAPYASLEEKIKATAKAKGLDKPSLIRRYAVGGRVNGPTNALIGEGGDAEYVIPMNNSSRAAGLLQQANAELSGINPSVGGQQNINYSPTINITGGNALELKSALSDSYLDFKAMMDRYAREARRVSF